MGSFHRRHSEDLRVMADLQGSNDPESLLKMRAAIDRMVSQNIRQVAFTIWLAKVNLSSLDVKSSASSSR